MGSLKVQVGKKVAMDSTGTRVGGVPRMPPGAKWPTCKECSGPMQFQFQVPLDELGLKGRLLQVFQCQNDPGSCEEWDPAAGGNAAMVVDAGTAAPLEPPQTKLDEGANPLVLDSFEIAKGTGDSVIGTIGGKPDWIQADETPTCECGAKMTLAAQCDEDAHEKFNFGAGGRAYAFACRKCGKQGAFLWQC